jgi:hypothetical protein
MHLDYEVAYAIETPVTVEATVAGRIIEATVTGLTVELISGTMAHTLRLTPDDLPAAKALFEPGARVRASFATA